MHDGGGGATARRAERADVVFRSVLVSVVTVVADVDKAVNAVAVVAVVAKSSSLGSRRRGLRDREDDRSFFDGECDRCMGLT